MDDSGLAAGRPPLPMVVSIQGAAGRAWARARDWRWLNSDTLAVFDAFVLLGFLGIYLKVALLAPQWGAVARFIGKQPGEALGWLDPVGFFASDLTLNLLIVPLLATAIVDLAFGAWRVVAACAMTAVCCLAYFVELRASSQVGQYISGEMLHDFIGWSSTHPHPPHQIGCRRSAYERAARGRWMVGAQVIASRGSEGVSRSAAAARCRASAAHPARRART